MRLEDAVAQLQRADRSMRASMTVDEADQTLSLGKLYNDCNWGGPAATALPDEALGALVLDDMTADSRWSKHFVNNKRTLGLYRSRVGAYWVLEYDALKRDHVLRYVGTAGDAASRFG